MATVTTNNRFEILALKNYKAFQFIRNQMGLFFFFISISCCLPKNKRNYYRILFCLLIYFFFFFLIFFFNISISYWWPVPCHFKSCTKTALLFVFYWMFHRQWWTFDVFVVFQIVLKLFHLHLILKMIAPKYSRTTVKHPVDWFAYLFIFSCSIFSSSCSTAPFWINLNNFPVDFLVLKKGSYADGFFIILRFFNTQIATWIYCEFASGIGQKMYIFHFLVKTMCFVNFQPNRRGLQQIILESSYCLMC